MKPFRAYTRWRYPWHRLLVLVSAAFLFGAAVRWATYRPLLDGACDHATGIPAQATAQGQYSFAWIVALSDSRREQQAAWQSVLDHFPADPVYIPLAQFRLGWLALRNGQHDVALAHFHELSELSESDGHLKTIGLAGQFIVETLDQNPAASATASQFTARIGGLGPKHLATFGKMLEETLHDQEMLAVLQFAIRQRQAEVRAETYRAWARFYESHF